MFSVTNLVAGYEHRMLIRNLFFSLPGPAFVAVVGHNGSGKTTLFKVLMGQVPYQGSIVLNGTNLQKQAPSTGSGFISYLPQKNIVTFPVLVRDLAVMGLFRKKRFLQHYSAADYRQTDQLLESLGISHLTFRDFTQLSGGEQQLVWLAQLMLQDSNLCLLDEPTQQLDMYHKKLVFDLLAKWVTDLQKTVFCITHDLPNLYGQSGYLLNLSRPQPELEPLTPETIRENIEFLEQKPVIK